MSSFPITQLPEGVTQIIFSQLPPRSALSLAMVQKDLMPLLQETIENLGAVFQPDEKRSLLPIYLAKFGISKEQIVSLHKMLMQSDIKLASEQEALRYLLQPTLPGQDLKKLAEFIKKSCSSFNAKAIERRKEWRQALIQLRRFDILELLVDTREMDIPDESELYAALANFHNPVMAEIQKIYSKRGITEEDAEKQALKIIEKAPLENLNQRLGGATLLHGAVNFNQYERARSLLKRGVCVNKPNASGLTPLNDALTTAVHSFGGIGAIGSMMSSNLESKKELIRLLVDYGATLNTRDIMGNTPLCFAVQRGHLELAQFLLDLGADIKFQNGAGQGPLLVAISRHGKDAEITQLLLRHATGQANKITSGSEESVAQIFRRTI